MILKTGFGIRQGHWKYHHSTCKYTVTMKPGLGSLKVIENDTIRSRTHEFLLTFHSNHRPISHRFGDKRRYPSKIANFSQPMYFSLPLKGFPWNLVSTQDQKTRMMGLPDGRKGYKIGLVI